MAWLHRLGSVVLAGFLLLAHPVAQGGQAFVIHHSANLRHSASTQSAVVAHLDPGAELTLLATGQTAGFYHVRTAAGDEGWVYHTLGHVEEADAVPAPASGGAAAFDPSWPKPGPTGSVLIGPPGTQPCPADGEAGGDTETNKRKNRTDVPTTYHEVAFSTLATLPYPVANTNRSKWTAPQLAEIAPFEGVAISVVGYIVAVKKQSGGGGESTNCHFNQPTFVDVHVALVAQAGQGEKDGVVIEPTPRFYPQHPTWVYSTLNQLDHSPDLVRISGWTLLDPVHKGHLGVFRSTLWEIHPITKIEVFRNGTWTPW
jgi:hypothetical protein